ncbi:MAG TPA: 5'-methylthioadenosine/adenosylhomocysteine nucleosidase [Methylibium sp.]|nr:5'-methylthioadenosine/adenosylhomocysteine nucleosidase [Methylibium sp.]
MTLGLMAAMHEELQALLPLLAAPCVHHHAGREFHSGRIDGRQVVLVRSPPGQVATATTVTLLAERFGAEALVSVGVAGGLHPKARIGDVVVARELRAHDLDAVPLFPRHEPPAGERAHLLTDPELSAALQAAAEAALAVERIALAGSLAVLGIAVPRVHAGLLLSGERFVATEAENAALKRAHPDALAVERQGVALAQVCHDCDLPFAVLRCISDRADERAQGDYDRFVAEVAGPFAATLLRAWLHGPAAPPAA